MRLGAIVQARTGSTRLPGKVLKKIADKTVLEHVVERLKFSTKLDTIIVSTTINPIDDSIVDLCKKQKIPFFRGSEFNVLERYYETASHYNLDVIVRVTSDCPLIDPIIVDSVIRKYLHSKYDLVTNAGLIDSQRTFPRGLDLEVFSFDILKIAHSKATHEYHKEHVTPYIYENFNNLYTVKSLIDYSNYRLTLDTHEDWILINRIFDLLYIEEKYFGLSEIVSLLEQNPSLVKINQQINQKKIY